MSDLPLDGFQSELPDGRTLSATPPDTGSAVEFDRVADIVVIGAGISGICAALSARELGADVVVLEKGPKFCANGMAQAAVDSGVQRQAGVEIDKEELISDMMATSGHRADEGLLRLWVDQSGACMDWLVGIAKTEGLQPTIGDLSVKYAGKARLFPTGVFFGGNDRLMACLESVAQSRGINILYNMPAREILREPGGRVHSVAATAPDGSSACYRANKAIVLCTGGFEGSREMMLELLGADAIRHIRIWQQLGGTQTGDGIRMATWIGAAMQDAPHCLMNAPGALPSHRVSDLAMLPWLYVDARGARFAEETSPFLGEAINDLPEGFAWAIFDANWTDHLVERGLMKPEDARQREDQLERLLDGGDARHGRNIGELAENIGVPAEALGATMTRYNDLCRAGVDQDFAKASDWLFPVGAAPFYAVNSGVRALVTVTGLQVTQKLEVVDDNGKVIPGLFAAGNCTGGFFAGVYPRNIPGISHGRAFTFGRLAGVNAATC